MARQSGQLTERQQRFVEAYAASGNGTKAATLAGYAKPDVEAVRLLANAKVAAALAALAEKRKSASIADAAERQAWWTKVMRGEQRNADMKDRLKAAELLGKAQGDFLERHEIVSGSLIDVMVYVPSNARG